MTEIKCVHCQKTLSGGTDTYGKVHTPQCQTCWLTRGDEQQPRWVHTIRFDDSGAVAELGIRLDDGEVTHE